MALFAERIDNKVGQLIFFNNKTLEIKQFPEGEQIGVAFCQSLYGADTQWKQTSYNGSFRGRYAGAGMTYDETLDEFVAPIDPTPVQ